MPFLLGENPLAWLLCKLSASRGLLIALLVACQTTLAEPGHEADLRLYLVSDIYSPPQADQPTDKAYADKCFQKARMACEQGDVGAAFRWASRTVAADPDHADARRVLAYRRVGQRWAGNYAARRLDRGETWHSKFGWIVADDRKRWTSGERKLGKRWISSEEDARRHQTIERGWTLRTDHFRVVTNHSREEAIRLATRLEQLVRLWQQLFGEYAVRADDLLKRFDGKESSSYRTKPFQVVYHRTRKQYNQALVRDQPLIGMSLGIYLDRRRETHFFFGPDQDVGTINHETVHQLFHESRPSARNVGALGNAWIMEGIACYFESLVAKTDATGRAYYTIGTPQAGRMPAARHRRLVDNYYVPLAELSRLGMDDLKRRKDIARLYSQSAGLATFFMHCDNGRYRHALIELLQRIYTGRDKFGTLEEVTGQSFAELDRQYLAYLKQLPGSQANP